ncbi:LCP family protein [Nocardioides fonticola]|uniref:LCP family protein n=1 Tax=Nocardioides fonticola TaxID=450363 RepID=A0ABP7XCB7_9ACTN
MSRRKLGRRRAPRPHHHVVLKVILASQLCLAILTATTVVLAYRHLNGNIDGEDLSAQVTVDPVKMKVEGPKEPLNILVMGSDNRDGAGNDIDGLTGGGQRSDTTILIHISADRKDAYAVSIPRDLMVPRPECRGSDGASIPGADIDIFNAAFSLGGPACTISTIGALTGVHIDHWVVVDFHGFEGMVDAVGGVEVCIPREVDDREHGIFFNAGTQVLKGREALNYVRERYVLSANSDIGRMKRQQAFMASMINKVFSAGTLSRPDRVFRFLNAATSSLTVDKGLENVGKLVDLAGEFSDTGLSNIRFVTVPFTTYEPDPNRLALLPAAKELWRRIRLDEPLGRQFSSSSISAAAPPGTTPTTGPSATPSDGSSPSASPTEGATTSAEARAEALANGLCA